MTMLPKAAASFPRKAPSEWGEAGLAPPAIKCWS
jgi:hypothetical protein